MYELLGSYAKGTSERGLAVGLVLCVTSIFGCWYLLFFRSRHQEIQSLHQHTRMLTKRIGTLKKTIKRSDQTLKELSTRSRSCALQKHFRSLPEALNYSMQALHASGVRVIRCKIDTKKEYELGVGQMVQCELCGSYESLYKLIATPSLTWHECRIVLQKEGLHFSGTFLLYAFKGQR